MLSGSRPPNVKLRGLRKNLINSFKTVATNDGNNREKRWTKTSCCNNYRTMGTATGKFEIMVYACTIWGEKSQKQIFRETFRRLLLFFDEPAQITSRSYWLQRYPEIRTSIKSCLAEHYRKMLPAQMRNAVTEQWNPQHNSSSIPKVLKSYYETYETKKIHESKPNCLPNHCRSARNACAQYCHAVVVPQLDVKLNSWLYFITSNLEGKTTIRDSWNVSFSHECRQFQEKGSERGRAHLLLVAWRFPVKQPNQECLLTASEETVEVLTWGENLFDHAESIAR